MPIADRTRSAKLAEKVAAALLEDIASQGWPVGKMIATKAELMSRYGVGQATVVEASRQLERLGVAELRRGAGGGLVVSRSPQDTVAWTTATYFDLIDVSLAEQMGAWRVIQEHALRLATERIREAGAQRLRDLAAALRQAAGDADFYPKLNALQLAIIDAAGNRATSLLARVLQPYWTRRGWDALFGAFNDVERARLAAVMSEVVEAVVAGDLARAMSRDPHLNGVLKEMVEARSPSFALAAPPEAAAERKLGETTALAVRDEIVRRGLLPGDRLGQMPELLLRYDVGVPAMREAVRLLELHNIAFFKTGRGGGLVVGEPSSAYTAQAIANFLLHTDMHPGGMFDIWRDLVVVAVETAARSPSRRLAEALGAPLRAEAGASGHAFRQSTVLYYRSIASLTPNRMLSLLVDCCAEFLGRYPWRAPTQRTVAYTHARHEAIARAMIAGDAPLARRRMLDFLTRARAYYNDAAPSATALPDKAHTV